MRIFFKALSCAIICCATGNALVLSGKSNSENLSDPGTGVPFDAVASLRNSSGGIGGSGIHLGNGYILTANHVGSLSNVTFDGTTFYTHDGATPIQVATGVDMKVFHLTTVPPVSSVQIYAGTDELLNPATIVAFGRGREGTGSSGTTVTWDINNGTVAKRWATNQPNATYPASSYNYDILATSLGSSEAANEAGLVLYDSGSGLFQLISETWYLSGLATAVTTGESSTFGMETPLAPNQSRNGPIGDSNYFVRTSSYRTQIASIIPEPQLCSILLVSGVFAFRRKR